MKKCITSRAGVFAVKISDNILINICTIQDIYFYVYILTSNRQNLTQLVCILVVMPGKIRKKNKVRSKTSKLRP